MCSNKDEKENENENENENIKKLQGSRTDVAEKLKQRKVELETVVKCTLKGITKKVQNVEFDLIDKNILKNTVLNCIESRVNIFSKRVVRGSILINYYIRYIIKKQLEQGNVINIPDYIFDQTFIRQLFLGNKQCSVKYDDYEEFLKNEKLADQPFYNDSEFDKRHLGDRNIYSFGAKKYITNCQNHLIMNFDSFLNKYLYNIAYKKYKNEKFLKDLVFGTRSLIHNWDNVKIPDSIKDLKVTIKIMQSEVDKIRKLLGCKESDVINKDWMKKNMSSILRLNVFILHQCEICNNQIKIENIDKQEKKLKKFTPCIKLFHLLPLHTIKPHFISIDNSVFEGLYNEVYSVLVKMYGDKRAANILPIMNDDWKDKDLKYKYWYYLFDIDKLEGKNQTFSNHIGSDGKAIDFHFKRHIEMKETFMKDLKEGLNKIEEKYKNETSIDNQKNNDDTKSKNERKRKKKKLKTQEDEESELILKFLEGK